MSLLPDRKRPLLFAHRGCSSLAPENTHAAFSLARQYGSPGIELDVHLCATGELVVFHDDTLRRIAGDSRSVEALSLEELRQLDLGSFFDPRFKNERMPLLEEVIEEFCPDLYIDIEMKSRKTKDDPLPLALAEKLRSLGARTAGAVTVSSFNPLCLAAFRRAAPGFPTAVIWCDSREVPPILRRGAGRWIAGSDYIKPDSTQCTGWNLFWMSGIERRPCVPWTVDDPEEAERLAALGAAGIITNRPQDMPARWRTNG
jgi:glycerophosphoryl diester phosphodiesterase